MGSESTGNDWLELPMDVLANILKRIGVEDRLESAQKVCTAYPALWRVLKVKYPCFPLFPRLKMYMHAIDLSEGQLVDVSIIDCNTAEILPYIADRACQLKRLHIAYQSDEYDNLSETLKKNSLLEELSLCLPRISMETIEAAARYCPRLKTLILNKIPICISECFDDGIAIVIAENFPCIRHLGVIYSRMSNIGLQVILDGCCQLESLDIRGCWDINLKGDLGKRCLEQIKYLRLPNDYVEYELYVDIGSYGYSYFDLSCILRRISRILKF